MRTIPLIFILVSVTFTGCELKWPWAKAPEKVRIQGLVKVCDAQGRLEQTLHYEQGLLQGPATAYYTDGRLRWTVNYLKGKKHGIQRLYYPDGTLKSEAPYVSGQLNGVLTAYDDKGRLVLEVPVKNGKINGEVIRYTRDVEGAGALPPPEAEPPAPKSTLGPAAIKTKKGDGMVRSPVRIPAVTSEPRRSVVDLLESPVDPQAMLGQQDIPGLPWEDARMMEDGRMTVPRRVLAGDVVDGVVPSWLDREDARVALGTDEPMTGRVAVSRPYFKRESCDLHGRRVYADDRVSPYPVEKSVRRVAPTETETACDRCGTFKTASYQGKYATHEEYPAAYVQPRRSAEPKAADNRMMATSRIADDRDRPGALADGLRREVLDDPRLSTRTRLASPALTAEPISSVLSTEDDTDALNRERLLRAYERRRNPATPVVQASAATPVYLVYPTTGARDAEAWRLRLLRQGVNPDDQVRRGL